MATYVKFDVRSYSWVTSEGDPDDEWSRDSTDGDVTILSATKVAEDGYDTLGFEGEVAAGTAIYLVWAKYGTGDSFGSDGGNYILLDVALTRDYAELRKQHYEDIDQNDYDGSIPWTGYFEWLQGLYVEKFVLK